MPLKKNMRKLFSIVLVFSTTSASASDCYFYGKNVDPSLPSPPQKMLEFINKETKGVFFKDSDFQEYKEALRLSTPSSSMNIGRKSWTSLYKEGDWVALYGNLYKHKYDGAKAMGSVFKGNGVGIVTGYGSKPIKVEIFQTLPKQYHTENVTSALRKKLDITATETCVDRSIVGLGVNGLCKSGWPDAYKYNGMVFSIEYLIHGTKENYSGSVFSETVINYRLKFLNKEYAEHKQCLKDRELEKREKLEGKNLKL